MDAVKFIKEKNRMCNSYSKCIGCPVDCDTKTDCEYYLTVNPEQYVKIVEKWSSEHPVKTRQSEFLKMFPNVKLDDNGAIEICPKVLDEECEIYCGTRQACSYCRGEYWLTERG